MATRSDFLGSGVQFPAITMAQAPLANEFLGYTAGDYGEGEQGYRLNFLLNQGFDPREAIAIVGQEYQALEDRKREGVAKEQLALQKLNQEQENAFRQTQMKYMADQDRRELLARVQAINAQMQSQLLKIKEAQSARNFMALQTGLDPEEVRKLDEGKPYDPIKMFSRAEGLKKADFLGAMFKELSKPVDIGQQKRSPEEINQMMDVLSRQYDIARAAGQILGGTILPETQRQDFIIPPGQSSARPAPARIKESYLANTIEDTDIFLSRLADAARGININPKKQPEQSLEERRAELQEFGEKLPLAMTPAIAVSGITGKLPVTLFQKLFGTQNITRAAGTGAQLPNPRLNFLKQMAARIPSRAIPSASAGNVLGNLLSGGDKIANLAQTIRQSQFGPGVLNQQLQKLVDSGAYTPEEIYQAVQDAGL